MANSTKGSDRRPLEDTYKIFHDTLRTGVTIPEALKIAGRSRTWYESRRREDAEFKKLTDDIRERVKNPEAFSKSIPDFPEFCEEYLNMKLWPHQLNFFDLLEGREPRWLHPAMTYEEGVAGDRRILINIPPNFAKTTTVTTNYVLWRLLKNPSMNIMLVSKTQQFSSKLLYAIKSRLTHPAYRRLQEDFGPVEGFKAQADIWTATRIYLNSDQSDGQAKDPQIEAVSLGGQIYGARAQLIIVDDAITLSNATQWESQMDWIRQEVATRIGPDDQLVVLGTRVAPNDLYRELRNPAHYNDEVVPWTYMGMPAVLEYMEDVEDWETLWPVTDQPFSEVDVPDADGLYARWTGARLAKIRNEVGPKRWSMVYQQMDVEEDSTFDPVCVKGSMDARRNVGPLVAGAHDAPKNMASVYVMCGVDPAVKGNTGFCVYAVDRLSGRRWVLDAYYLTAPTPKQIRERIEEITVKFSPHEFIVEANAYQLALVQDELINEFLASRGVLMKPHYTHSHNKKDLEYGVASMSGLFGTTEINSVNKAAVHAGDNLLSLPQGHTPGIKKLVDELVSWSAEVPTRYRQQDLVMSMWFCELRARELVTSSKRKQFYGGTSAFLSQRDRDRRYVVNLDDIASEQEGQRVYI